MKSKNLQYIIRRKHSFIKEVYRNNKNTNDGRIFTP